MNTLVRSTARFAPKIGRRNQSTQGTLFQRFVPVEVYPIIGCIGFAVGLCTWFNLRVLFTHPDMKLTKTTRAQMVKQGHMVDEGKKYTKHRNGWNAGGCGFKSTTFPKEGSETGKNVTLFA